MTQKALWNFENSLTLTVWSVTDITREIREILEGEESLQDIWVSGEVSNFSRPSSGHIYFTLKESQASLRCVMWKTHAARQAVLPRDGDAIEIHGGVGVYEQGGQYQFYVDQYRPIGEGNLYREFLRIKDRLEAEGCFSDERKKAIPTFPKRIGLITSPTGAAVRDVLQTISGRDPLTEVYLIPIPVQGTDAPEMIVKAIQDLDFLHPDVVILTRGGGSIEDLWAFNDESVARAILACPYPIVTGIGHETDFTIADFVADLRAPTPTGAAVLSTPDMTRMSVDQGALTERMTGAIQRILNDNQESVDTVYAGLLRESPLREILNQRQRVEDMLKQSYRYVSYKMDLEKARLDGIRAHLLSLNPEQILMRGYAVVEKQSGEIVRNSVQVSLGETIRIRLYTGKLKSKVTEVEV